MEKQYRMHCDVTLPDKPHSNNNNKSQDACAGGMKGGHLNTALLYSAPDQIFKKVSTRSLRVGEHTVQSYKSHHNLFRKNFSKCVFYDEIPAASCNKGRKGPSRWRKPGEEGNARPDNVRRGDNVEGFL